MTPTKYDFSFSVIKNWSSLRYVGYNSIIMREIASIEIHIQAKLYIQICIINQEYVRGAGSECTISFFILPLGTHNT